MNNDEFIVFVYLPDDNCLPLKANNKLFIRQQIHRSRPPARDLLSSIVVVIIVIIVTHWSPWAFNLKFWDDLANSIMLTSIRCMPV